MNSFEPAPAPTGVPPVGATLGVEEEFHVLDPDTGRLTAAAPGIIEAVDRENKGLVEKEFKSSMVETATPVCSTLDELRLAMTFNRRTLLKAADRLGLWIASSGTVPDAGVTGIPVYPDERYQRIHGMYLQLAVEQQVCACHVHVGVPDPELAVAIIPRIRGWLPVMLALSASSPYFQHVDTGYDSYRSVILGRWPTGGPPPVFADGESYWGSIDQLVQAGVITDRAMVYYDARVSARYPTVEVRISDSNPRVDTLVMLAGLSRALVITAAEEIRPGAHDAGISDGLVRGATWQASRHGLRGGLIDPTSGVVMDASRLIGHFLNYLRPALESHGDYEFVTSVVEELLQGGTNSEHQRRMFELGGEMAVISALVAETRAML
ncbi:MAG: glutamate--cysteine ligase [Longispora sp.]|nr:glutamate--cysteine ligase [Longispora sp. (in: high G+C Gram-positive bacteria)]